MCVALKVCSGIVVEVGSRLRGLFIWFLIDRITGNSRLRYVL
jgi:hypothetical protein